MTTLDSRCYAGDVTVRSLRPHEQADQAEQLRRAERIKIAESWRQFQHRRKVTLDAVNHVIDYERERALRQRRRSILNP
jgi:hypothetical protein